MRFAEVIVDKSIHELDRTFTYIIPDELTDELRPGVRVSVPFGAQMIKGYVIGITDGSELPAERLKPVAEVLKKDVPVEGRLIELARWMSEYYGCTMNQALKTVLMSRKKVAAGRAKKKQTELPEQTAGYKPVMLNAEQRDALSGILGAYPEPSLLFGVTGSGKTEVYMELTEEMRRRGLATILLIPEISLTYQNLRRFHERFGDRVAVVNSRLSDGERYESFEKAKNGSVDLMIGPRSALFTPFQRLGLIIVDEEHDGAYRSETSPRYDTVEVALKRAEIEGAGVVLGSATPSMGSYHRALAGELQLVKLTRRAREDSSLPAVSIIDMREELRSGNRSVFSRAMHESITKRLQAGEQIMLFLNRRGYSGFISCRSCGKVIKCPHCNVSLTAHKGGLMICHYCGYTIQMPDRCPDCGSPYLAGFGIGTQKVESAVKKAFPGARTLRMDLDTTSAKDGHSKILSAFRKGAADILIGTQMIVKGHDFPNVTLVGILAADMSLFVDDYRASERTFQLLVQAAGRAGRAGKAGEVMVQTYDPDNMAITCAAKQDYEAFYEEESGIRRLVGYPPEGAMMSVLIKDEIEEKAAAEADRLARLASESCDAVTVTRPAPAGIGKIKDQYRFSFYIKSKDRARLFGLRDILEKERDLQLQIDIE